MKGDVGYAEHTTDAVDSRNTMVSNAILFIAELSRMVSLATICCIIFYNFVKIESASFSLHSMDGLTTFSCVSTC